MAQDFIVVAPGLHQGVGQGGHPVEGSFVIDRLGHLYHGGRQQGGIDGDGYGAEGVPKMSRSRMH
jgi:hypothetical protein